MKQMETLLDGFVFLEGPRWHEGRLFFSDMWGHAVYSASEDGDVKKIAEVPGRPSGLNFLPDGRLIVVSMADRKLFEISKAGSLSEYADLSDIIDSDINDSVVDSAGNIYVGSFGYDLFANEEPKLASMAIVEKNGSVGIAADGLNFPNGAVISPSGDTLICAETFGHCLTAFNMNSTGQLTNRRVWADLGEHTPDGICLDAEGAIWVASFVTGVFLRVQEGGKITEEISVHGKRAVACNLGGADGCTLFGITFEGEIEDIGGEAKKARVEICRVEVPTASSP